MFSNGLKRGDTVIYHDKDQVRWGPWEVVSVVGDQATVQIEAHISCLIHTSLLQKVREDRQLN